MNKLLLPLMLLLTIPLHVYSQRHSVRQVLPDACESLNTGIFLNVTEFLNNDPSIPYNFEVVDFGPDYYLYPEERSAYLISYTDNMGYRKTLGMDEIWGYYDGKAVFLTYHGRPYELLQFGAISILRYHQRFHRNLIAQAFSLYTVGSTVTSTEKIQDVLFHLKNDTIVIPTMKSFKRLIQDDEELYQAYKHDKKTDLSMKPLIYLERYNQKHTVRMTDRGIEFQDMPVTSDVTDEVSSK